MRGHGHSLKILNVFLEVKIGVKFMLHLVIQKDKMGLDFCRLLIHICWFCYRFP